MKISRIINQSHKIRDLLDKEYELIEKILKNNLFFNENDSVLIVTDDKFYEKEAALWFETAKQLSQKVKLIEVTGMKGSGQEPPQEIVDEAEKSDVIILQTSFSLTHTKAGKMGRMNGGKVASLPGVGYEMIHRTLTADYLKIDDLGKKLKKLLENSKKIKITSKFGTNLVADVDQNNIINDGGFISSGLLGNLPAGEVFFPPIANSTKGTWVVNGSLADDVLESPITLEIESGKVIDIRGGNVAKRLKNKLQKIGDLAFNVAEIGIGTNPETDPKGRIIEAEKAHGTAHMAVGNNIFMGGTNDVPIHLDMLTLEPEIYLDDKLIFIDGEFLI